MPTQCVVAVVTPGTILSARLAKTFGYSIFVIDSFLRNAITSMDRWTVISRRSHDGHVRTVAIPAQAVTRVSVTRANGAHRSALSRLHNGVSNWRTILRKVSLGPG